MVHDPDLVVGARRDGDRLEPDRHRCDVLERSGRIHVEDLELAVGGVDREEASPSGDSASGAPARSRT
jgi:hypothetical protein